MVKTKNANVGKEGHGEAGGSSRDGKKGKDEQVARSETPLDKFISVQAAANYKDWTHKKRKIASGHQFYANLQRGRTQSNGNVIISRINGKNIVFDDKLLNSILETPEDGMCFYTKNKKCFDPNLYSEKRFEEIFTKGILLKRIEDRTVDKLDVYGRILHHIISNIVFQHFKITFFGPNDHIGIGKIYNQNTFKRMRFSRNEDGRLIRGGQEEDTENMDEDETNEEEIRREISVKATLSEAKDLCDQGKMKGKRTSH
ncbi:hypothetical protein M9H77_06895 [Catharanthus roseus]|uniref:Uncharacterized protein n=1 Tax=Catharanthus roseus TaxID=4058 RepID=A0ACC0BTJ7_CATRO|nr:hypothetical protein M9H77_06895 [Catharanthus roseus]